MKKLATLQEIYSVLPTMDCKKLCGDEFCNAIELGKIEELLVRTWLTQHSRKFVPFKNMSNKRVRLAILDAVGLGHPESFQDPALRCPYLDDKNECSIYDARPLICRLWGMTESMVCPYGCKPKVLISDDNAGRVLETVAKI